MSLPLGTTLVALLWGCGADMVLSKVGDDGGGGVIVLWQQLAVAPAELNVTATAGESPIDGTFHVWNSETTWTSSMEFIVSETCPWLECSPGSGHSSGDRRRITVRFSTADMAPGTYSYQINILSATGSPFVRVISVNLIVRPAPTVTATFAEPDGAATLTWSSSSGGRYTILSCPDLCQGEWGFVADVVATRTICTWTDAVASSTSRFYKIRIRSPFASRVWSGQAEKCVWPFTW